MVRDAMFIRCSSNCDAYMGKVYAVYPINYAYALAVLFFFFFCYDVHS